MENTQEIEWKGDSEERLLETALDLEAFGKYNGNVGLGKRLLQQARLKIDEVASNLNLYAERPNRDGDRVAPLASGYILVYRKVYYKDQNNTDQVKLVIHDIRKSY